MNLLGVLYQKPSYNALSEIVSSHITCIPFENVSKIYYKNEFGQRSIPSMEQFLNGIEYHSFGGTCYSNNYYLYKLLDYLGYNVKLCGADIKNPDVHIVNIVTINNKEYLVDVGNAAPFITPMPLYLNVNYEISCGRDFYILLPKGDDGRSRMMQYRDGALKGGYLINPQPRSFEHFDNVITDSFKEDAVFMNGLLLVKIFPDHTITIHNNNLLESRGKTVKRKSLGSNAEIIGAISRIFYIDPDISKMVLASIAELKDIWD